MAVVEIKSTYKKGDTAREINVAYDFGANLAEAVAKFGADVIFNNYVRSAKITIQAAVRRWAEDGLDDASIAQKVSSMQIGVAAERVVDPKASILGKFANMSPEDQAEIIQKLKQAKKVVSES